MRSDTVKLALKSASPVIGGLALVALALLQWNAAQDNIERFSLICDSCTDRSEQQLYAWSRRTEEGAVFAIPPRLEGFRLFAKRAVVADYKALPFRADELVEWHDRMIDLCGAGASYSRRDMEDGYGDATRARIDKLSKKYGVGYVVARKGTSASGLDYPTAFENEKFRVLLVK
jgi:hypothetical protein